MSTAASEYVYLQPAQDGPAPLSVKLAPRQAVAPQAATATFDGTGAAAPFVPCLSLYAQNGQLLARSPCGTTLAIGQSAEVTFSPFVPPSSGGAGSAGIQFDVDNVGDWLDIKTTGFEPIDGNGMHLRTTGDGNPMFLESEGGFTIDDDNGWGFSLKSTAGTGGSADWTLQTDRDQTYNAGRDISFQAASFFNLASLDTMDIGAATQLQLVSNGTGGINVQVNSATATLFVQGTPGALIVLDPSILPTVAPATSGALWNNAGVIHVVP